MPRYKSLKSGKFVSEYYAKRHPETTVLVDQPKPRIPLLGEAGGQDPRLAERFEDELRRTIKTSAKEGTVSREDARKAVREVAESRLQHSEIYLSDVEEGIVTVEPKEGREQIQLQFNTGWPRLYRISPEEAHALGSALVEHAIECGYDPDTDETKPVG